MDAPIGTVVKDSGGELWRRDPHGWVSELSPGRWDSGAGSGLAWRDLVRCYGPVTPIERSRHAPYEFCDCHTDRRKHCAACADHGQTATCECGTRTTQKEV